MKIDPMINNIGYRLGRLLALLDKIEIEADPGADPQHRCPNFGMAMTRPITIFAEILKKGKEDLQKIPDTELRAKLTSLLAYLTEDLREIPTLLHSPDQTMFMTAYDKQKQYFSEGMYE